MGRVGLRHRRPQEAGDACSRSSTPSATKSGFYRSDDAGTTWARIGKHGASRRGGGRGGAGTPAATPQPAALGHACRRAQAGAAAGRAAGATTPPASPAAASAARRRRPGGRRQPAAAGGRRGRRLVPRRRRAVLPRDLRRSVPARHDLLDEHQRRAQHRRRQDLGADQLGEHAPACHVDHHAPRRSTRPTRTTSCSATTAASTRPTTKARRGGSSPTCRSRSTTACRPTTRSRSTTSAAARRTTGRTAARRARSTAGACARATGSSSPAATASRRATIPKIRPSSTRRRRTATSSRLDLKTGRLEVDPAAAVAPDAAAAAATTRCGGERQARRRCRRRAAPRAARRAGAAGGQAPARRRAGAGGRGGAADAAAGDRRELGRALHHQPALADAALLGEQQASIAATTAATPGRAISPDLSRNLNRDEIPIMGKVWPADSVALNTSTTALSNIVSLDESPLLEGLIYVGHRRRAGAGDRGRREELAEDRAVPRRAAVDLRHRRLRVAARRRTPCSSTLNNWQRGDYKPYIVKSTDRGQDLDEHHRQPAGPPRRVVDHPGSRERRPAVRGHRVRPVRHAWTAARHWVQLKGGMPSIQVRDMTVQKRENDLVLATFGRGFYILDDYSALREITPQTLAEEARLFPLRDAYSFNPTRHGAGRHGGHRPDGRATGRRPTRRSARCSPTT